MTAVQTMGSGSALAVANPWALVPPLGNLDAYISAANRLPNFTLTGDAVEYRSGRTPEEVAA